MPKASPLEIDLTADTQQPPAATAPRTIKEPQGREVPPAKEATGQVNFRWPVADVKAMKREALEADMTMQDYLLTCFRAYLQHNKKAS